MDEDAFTEAVLANLYRDDHLSASIGMSALSSYGFRRYFKAVIATSLGDEVAADA